MEQHIYQTEINLINNKIKEETDHYFEAITRKKDFTAARNIKLKINSLNKNLSQMLNNNPIAK